MAAGYSHTPLAQKLGIKPGVTVKLVNPPSNYFNLTDPALRLQLVSGRKVPDLLHVFVQTQAALAKEMKSIVGLAKKNPAIIVWVSWYKKSSGIVTDVTEDAIRNLALKNGLVDVKVCAVSEMWSGLKLVVPLRLRQKS